MRLFHGALDTLISHSVNCFITPIGTLPKYYFAGKFDWHFPRILSFVSWKTLRHCYVLRVHSVSKNSIYASYVNPGSYRCIFWNCRFHFNVIFGRFLHSVFIFFALIMLHLNILHIIYDSYRNLDQKINILIKNGRVCKNNAIMMSIIFSCFMLTGKLPNTP